MIIAHTYACDWPGCGMIQTMIDKQFNDKGWEHRQLDRHVCPDHRFKTEIELQNAIDTERINNHG